MLSYVTQFSAVNTESLVALSSSVVCFDFVSNPSRKLSVLRVWVCTLCGTQEGGVNFGVVFQEIEEYSASGNSNWLWCTWYSEYTKKKTGCLRKELKRLISCVCDSCKHRSSSVEVALIWKETLRSVGVGVSILERVLGLVPGNHL